MLNATDLRKNTYFVYRGDPFRVLEYQHTHLGRGGGKTRVKIRNIKTGQLLSQNFSGSDRFEEVYLEKRSLQLIKDLGNQFLFLDPDEAENIKIDKKIVGEAEKFLTPGEKTTFLFWEDEPIDIELPLSITMEIAECEPGYKGNSTTNIYKNAVTKNGLELKVPLFVNVGDKVRVDTRTGEYLERA